MKMLIAFLGWCILLVLSGPTPNSLALINFRVWLVTLPFRLVAVSEAVSRRNGTILFLPAAHLRLAKDGVGEKVGIVEALVPSAELLSSAFDTNARHNLIQPCLNPTEK